MTNEEAINLLDNLVGMVEDNHNSDYDKALKMGIEALKKQSIFEQIKWERDVALEQLESIGVGLGRKMDDVKEAMEKQIPKKPKENIVGIYCPECKHFFSGTEYYCGFCGQFIDWGEEE